MKTKKISLKIKDNSIYSDLLACGSCFALIEVDDEFCWNCGAEFDLENTAYDLEDLIVKKVKSKKI